MLAPPLRTPSQPDAPESAWHPIRPDREGRGEPAPPWSIRSRNISSHVNYPPRLGCPGPAAPPRRTPRNPVARPGPTLHLVSSTAVDLVKGCRSGRAGNHRSPAGRVSVVRWPRPLPTPFNPTPRQLAGIYNMQEHSKTATPESRLASHPARSGELLPSIRPLAPAAPAFQRCHPMLAPPRRTPSQPAAPESAWQPIRPDREGSGNQRRPGQYEPGTSAARSIPPRLAAPARAAPSARQPANPPPGPARRSTW